MGSIAGAALLIRSHRDRLQSPSAENGRTDGLIEELTGQNVVYWTKSGSKYHIYVDCHAINRDATTEIFEGTVAKARELKNITELCKFCEARAEKDRLLPDLEKTDIGEEIMEKVEELTE